MRYIMSLKHKDFSIINDDILNTNEIKSNSIDLIITSPPYNVEIDYNSTNDNLNYEKYLSFCSGWMSKCFNLLKPDGRLCLNVPLTVNKNGSKPLGSDLIQKAIEIGYQYKTIIIWNKNHIPTRTAWGSWLSASAPSVIPHIEIIIVFYKDQWKKINKGESTIKKDEFVKWTNGLWTFAGEKKKNIKHPAPFPLELPDRCIKLFSYKTDLILDPFVGSGTTLISAYKNNRKCIGVEIDKQYYELAINRFSNTEIQIEIF